MMLTDLASFTALVYTWVLPSEFHRAPNLLWLGFPRVLEAVLLSQLGSGFSVFRQVLSDHPVVVRTGGTIAVVR